MVKGAIFDVDGTLLNSMPVWENLGELYLKRLGIEAEKELGDILCTISMQQGAEYLVSHYHLELTTEQVMDGISREIRDFYVKRVPLKEGARSFLEGLRELRIPMIAATSGDGENVEAAFKRLNIWNMFEMILTCTGLQTDKNHPDIYLTAALQMDCDPDEVLVFEDAYHALRTAKNAGFKTVAVYDKSSDRDLGKIWNLADIYLPAFDDFQIFWRRVEKLG